MSAVPPFFWPLGEGDEPGDRLPGSIGHDGGTFLVVDPDGSVIAHDPLGELPSRYVNRSVEQFTSTLRLFAGTWKRGPELSEAEASAQAEELRRSLRQVDQSAFADPENWWAVVMEQIILGLI